MSFRALHKKPLHFTVGAAIVTSSPNTRISSPLRPRRTEIDAGRGWRELDRERSGRRRERRRSTGVRAELRRQKNRLFDRYQKPGHFKLDLSGGKRW
eukprot:763596-Hanusia_phi.AAC.4